MVPTLAAAMAMTDAMSAARRFIVGKVLGFLVEDGAYRVTFKRFTERLTYGLNIHGETMRDAVNTKEVAEEPCELIDPILIGRNWVAPLPNLTLNGYGEHSSVIRSCRRQHLIHIPEIRISITPTVAERRFFSRGPWLPVDPLFREFRT
jgi:hypothetical protein